MIALLPLLLACGPQGPSECTPAPRAEVPSLAITTADPGFEAGQLRVGDIAGFDTPRFGTHGDAIVRFLDERLYVVERGPVNAITAFDPLDTKCPLWQRDLGEGANAHDVVALNDRLYLPLYDAGRIAVLDVDGTLLDPIQVPGEQPALDRAVAVGDTLWVADQRLDRSDWASSQGVLLAIRDGEITEYPAGPNPRLAPGRTPTELLVADGLLAVNASQAHRVTDGELVAFDTTTGRWSEPLVAEEDLQADIQGVVAVDGALVVTLADAQARSRVHCVGVGDGPSDDGYFPTIAPWNDRAVVAVRSGPAGVGERGLWVIDPVRCERVEHLVVEGSEPYDVASL